ncbi:hypothetical protein CTI12_AA318090 [Artemisia annua]|uniref:Uncharacterized protein n=1 Tax=Artemisia annua TaxID=35608 RepID=A0A2U1N291_ARTAN|nr:hypothetical protein CTI12_AA318090 [Artemisia annua]
MCILWTRTQFICIMISLAVNRTVLFNFSFLLNFSFEVPNAKLLCHQSASLIALGISASTASIIVTGGTKGFLFLGILCLASIGGLLVFLVLVVDTLLPPRLSESRRSKFVAWRSSGPNVTRPNVPSNSDIVCENCGYIGHTIDRCFKIIGYPADFGKKKVGQGGKGKNVAYNSVGSSGPDTLTGSSGFTDEQLATLVSLIKENKVCSSPKGLSAQLMDKAQSSSVEPIVTVGVQV